ncbi:hypothetical protein [Nitrospira calida]|jgi:hypothetical protein
MSNAETILKFLEGTTACCDDCIATATGIEPRQQVNQICRRLEPRHITRRQDRRVRCGRTKTVNVIRDSTPQARVTVSAPEPAMSRGLSLRAKLICDKLDLNDIELVRRLLETVTAVLSAPAAWHALELHRECYFRTPEGRLPTDPGWYVICDAAKAPLYVGEAQNLDARLNNTNGSLDQFADSGRTQDPARNFIKALTTMGSIPALRVGIVLEPDLLSRVGVQGLLERLDRGNVEKLLGLLRHVVVRSGV